MHTADLYIRVSTDEQADKGYSQRDQEERLRRYCEANNITIGKVIFEDHSAKNFNRPEWTKLLGELKKRSSRTTHVFFTKWDRFSRNAGDAYQMLSILTKLGIEIQAIEQPLDLSIPENKMMLAIYLAAPEVENDRRALNTFYGMRKAKKEGRVMGQAPFGYSNRISEDGKRKYIAIKHPEATTMRRVFDEIEKQLYTPDQIRQIIVSEGTGMLSMQAFHVAIRNPVYCGKVFIPKFKDEEAYLVQGQHEALISEQQFDNVQAILDGRKKKVRTNVKLMSDAHLPLRGFLICPKCGKNLTGSASKGRTGLYYYYHCIASCGFRHKAEAANDIFTEHLKGFELREPYKKVLQSIILDGYKQIAGNTRQNRKKAIDEIETLNKRLSIARDKLLQEKIDDEDYLIIKRECKDKIEKLESELEKQGVSNTTRSIESSLDKALAATANLSSFYKESGIATKRRIIGSIYPEKTVFDGTAYRTNRLNVILKYIFQLNNELEHKKNRSHPLNLENSCYVVPTRIELVSKV